MRVAILAHGKFPDRAKTAVGVLRYGDQEVVGVLDRDRAGARTTDLVGDVADAPVYADMDALLEAVGADGVDALVIGIAPIGGGFEDTWRPDVRAALRAGCDVVAGLHYFLAEDPEFAQLADEHGCELRDLRRPPEDLTVSDGVADGVDAEVILTVGTDCSVGKMTTSMELARAGREAGYDVGVVPTGQTGILIEGWGIAVDRVISDFTAGAVERLVLEAADRGHDYLIVEGQGSIVHPAYSGVTCSILHGAMPDRLVLCHTAGRGAVHGYEDTPLPSPDEYVELYEDLARPVHPTSVVAGALNTASVDRSSAREAVTTYSTDLELPATDPVRFGADEILEAVFE